MTQPVRILDPSPAPNLDEHLRRGGGHGLQAALLGELHASGVLTDEEFALEVVDRDMSSAL